MTQTIREQLERFMVEEPVGDGTYRKVSLMEYADRYAAEAVAVERERIAAAVEGLPKHELVPYSIDWFVHLPSVLAIVQEDSHV